MIKWFISTVIKDAESINDQAKKEPRARNKKELKTMCNDFRTNKNAREYFCLSDLNVNYLYDTEEEARAEMECWAQELRLNLAEGIDWDDEKVEALKDKANDYDYIEMYADATIYLEKVILDDDGDEDFIEVDRYTESEACAVVLRDHGIDF